MSMTTTVTAARLGQSDLAHLLTLGGRMFLTEASTPCKEDLGGADLWFSPHRDRVQAARRCLDCPFLGRCGYNAVISRATHGVWGGQVLPGDKAAELEPIYARLLDQFEERRTVELGDAPPPPLPKDVVRRRRRAQLVA
jgi:WhiB family redox-sensing transcriptional regulator